MAVKQHDWNLRRSFASPFVESTPTVAMLICHIGTQKGIVRTHYSRNQT
jgi:hypothetical protein